MEVDFVVTWVDMNDLVWQADFAKYLKQAKIGSEGHAEPEFDTRDKKNGVEGIDNSKNELSEARFRDHGFLKYWFRGVEKFAPWVHRIHFVTCGQCPDWLDTTNPRLHLVDHKDFIPTQFLPIFNSASIEMYLHKIPGLAEHFVYFNDDFFITRDVPVERFFRNGLPCDIATFRFNSGIGQWSKRIENNVRLINKHFDKREVLSRWHDKWFYPEYGSKARWNYILALYPRLVALRTPHNAQPYLKSTFEDLWNNCEAELLETSTHRFRSVTDLTPELIRTWQICRGTFEPLNTYLDTKMFPLVVKPGAAIRAVRKQLYRLVCLNDNVHIHNYDGVMASLEYAFAAILPEKSSFEI